MAQKIPKVNAHGKKKPNLQKNRSMNGIEDSQKRTPSGVNRPVQVVDNLPLFNEIDQFMTAEWVDMIEGCWDQVVHNLPRGVIGWRGVRNYQAKEKTGDIVISVTSPLDWNEGTYEDEVKERKAKVREVFSRGLGIEIRTVFYEGIPGMTTTQKWKRTLRPFVELPTEVAVLPNEWCETSLFIPVKPGRHRFIDGELLVKREDVEVRMTGKQLNMKDARLLMAIIRMLDNQPLDDFLETSWRQLIREAGREKGSFGADQQNAIWSSLHRLAFGLLDVKGLKSRMRYVGHLVDDFFIDENTGRLLIRLNPRIRSLLQNLNYLQVDYCQGLNDPELWLYMAVSKDMPGKTQYRQLRDVYAKYTSKQDFKEGAYKWWVSKVAKPGLAKMQRDGKIKNLSITPRKGGHVATWAVVANSWHVEDKSDVIH